MEHINSVFEDPFTVGIPGAEENEAQDDFGTVCEIKTYEARYNSRGERKLLDVGARKVGNIEDKDHESAIVATRYYGYDQTLEYTTYEVRSPHIQAALRKVIPDEYPGIDLNAKRIITRELPKCLFHFQRELRTYGDAVDDEDAQEHVAFALEYMLQALGKDLMSYFSLVEFSIYTPSLDFHSLWMIFRPGERVYYKQGTEDRLYAFVSMQRCECVKPHCAYSSWKIKVRYLEYDGENFGLAKRELEIAPYDNYRNLDQLRVFPVRYHRNGEAIMQRMIARGKKFVRLHGTHHKEYNDIAGALSPIASDSSLGYDEDQRESIKPPLRFIKVKGRVMIDAKQFNLARPRYMPHISGKRLFRTNTSDHLKLSDDDLMISNDTIRGFSFVDKLWCQFKIDSIEDFKYNTGAFSALLLPTDQKEMIHSLVKVHGDERLEFDDIIKGKGKGMIFLLHGTPGTGKTLTAESVADCVQRPLYTVSAGELGLDAAEVERALGNALQLATTWNAIVLIDEADVFLEQRSAHALARNALISVFLRELEYFEGIMFLTTNRIGSFDRAFKSRIHLAIKYHDLSHNARRNLWRTFLLGESYHSNLDWLGGSVLDSFAAEELDGRQIKHIVRTAYALAVSENAKITEAHVKKALNAMKTFDDDIQRDRWEQESQDGTSSKGTRSVKRRRIDLTTED